MNLRILLLLVMLAFTSAGVGHANAQGDDTNAGPEPRQKIHYQIAPQPLNTALRDFALTSGLQVSFPDDVTLGRMSREEIYAGSVAFVIIQIIMIALLIAFPQLVTGNLDAKVEVDLDTIRIEAPSGGGGWGEEGGEKDGW